MAEFTKAFQLMIAHEGGYVNDPDDPGGRCPANSSHRCRLSANPA